MSTISVVMSTYNGNMFIKNQLNSILTQTIKPDEIIVVDDCSQDNTFDTVSRLLSASAIHHKLIRHDKNMGVNQSFCDGVLNASSDFIMFCDQDDIWKNSKIEVTKSFLDSNVVLAVCNATIVDKDLTPIGQSMFEYIELPIKFKGAYVKINSAEMKKLLLRRNFVTGMCMIGRRDLMKQAIPFPRTMMYDTWLAWTLAKKGWVSFINDELVLYRQHENNVIGTVSKERSIKNYISYRESILKQFLDKYTTFLLAEATDSESRKMIEQACMFYKNRIKITNFSRLNKLRFILKSYSLDYYKMYTGKQRNEIIKDLVTLLF